MCEIALAAVSYASAAWHTTFAFLFHPAASIAPAHAQFVSRFIVPNGNSKKPEGRTRTYARTARLRFSSATRGRFCAGVEVESSIANISETAVGTSSAQRERSGYAQGVGFGEKQGELGLDKKESGDRRRKLRSRSPNLSIKRPPHAVPPTPALITGSVFSPMISFYDTL
jgi:hypothetical protein